MVTQEEIAKRLGVTRTTVARALAGSDKVSLKTREKVMRLVHELGYVKNYIGSSLALKRKKVVYAFILKTKNSTYNSEIKRGLQTAAEELKEYNFKVEIIETAVNLPKVQAQKLKKILETKKPEGVIITPIDQEEIEKILEGYHGKIKILALEREVRIADYYVTTDYFKAGRIAGNIMEKLLRKGEKLLIVDAGDDEITSGLYLEGFCSKVEESELKIIGPVRIKNAHRKVERLEKFLTAEVKGLYINMYSSEILQELFERGYEGLKIVTNLANETIKNFILEGKVDAAVLESLYQEGYTAGIKIFEMIYKDVITEVREVHLIKSHVIFKENIDNYW